MAKQLATAEVQQKLTVHLKHGGFMQPRTTAHGPLLDWPNCNALQQELLEKCRVAQAVSLQSAREVQTKLGWAADFTLNFP